MKKSAVIIFLFVVLAGFFYFYLSFLLTTNAQTKVFTIMSGEGASEISAHLRENGFIKSTFVFESYVWLKKTGSKMQIGEYEITPRMPLSKLMREFTATAEQRERKITLIEGWTVRDIGFYLENQRIEQAEGLWELVGFQGVDYRKNNTLPRPKDFSADYEFLLDKPSYLGLEGYLFPDTYRIRANAGREEITRKALDNFDRKLTRELRAEIKRQGKTVFDIVRMASVIEAEVPGVEDRKLVSDIFWRRLKIGMALQADSTVNYITLKNTPAVSRDDLATDSPWNTYKYRGLPLGPIGNPGMESILAAIYPTLNQNLYFLTDKDGNVHYGKTLDDHNKNKQVYLKR